MTSDQVSDIAGAYRKLRARVPLGTLRTKADYSRAVAIVDTILDEIGEEEKHPLAELADALSLFIERYEAEHERFPAADPVGALKFLMNRHDLRQSDLPEVGSQGVVSEVLRGQRDLNAGQIRRLAKRFGVSPAVFI